MKLAAFDKVNLLIIDVWHTKASFMVERPWEQSKTTPLLPPTPRSDPPAEASNACQVAHTEAPGIRLRLRHVW
jgi:hypothetical protein